MGVQFLCQHLVILTFCVLPVWPQTLANARGTGVVTGRVWIGNQPAVKVVVDLVRDSARQPGFELVSKTVTDNEGRYRLEAIPPGIYRILPLAPGYSSTSDNPAFYEPGKLVQLAVDELLTNVDFQLVRGGVITGKVLDQDGKPLIEQRVNLTLIEGEDGRRSWNPPGNTHSMMLTDDRGIYRIFGIPPGRYIVSAGTADDYRIANQVQGLAYRRAYFPGTTDANKAKRIEVTPGSEIKEVDIRLASQIVKGYAAVVHVLDHETGKPLPGLEVGFGPIVEGRMLGSFFSPPADASGTVRFEGLAPGKYGVLLVPRSTPSQYFSEIVQFEIVESDAEDVQLTAQRGVTLTGKVVLEGVTDPVLQAKLLEIRLFAFSRGGNRAGSVSLNGRVGSRVKFNPDGSFQVSGLAPGFIWFSAVESAPDEPSFYLQRIEVDGVPQKFEIEVAAGQEVHNLRLVFAYGQATVLGQVLMTGATLPDGARLTVTANRTDSQNLIFKSAEVDSRGRFTLAGLVGGEYQLTLEAVPDYSKGPSPLLPRTLSQKVMVPPTGEVTVNLTLNLTP